MKRTTEVLLVCVAAVAAGSFLCAAITFAVGEPWELHQASKEVVVGSIAALAVCPAWFLDRWAGRHYHD